MERGPALAAVARRRLAAYPAAEVVTAGFEEWAPPGAPHDAVVCATAFHWLNPALRVPKAAGVFRPGGLLALVTTRHVAGGTEDFFTRVQRRCERWVPGTPPALRLRAETEVATDTSELERSPLLGPPLGPLLGPVAVTRHPQEIGSTAAHFDLLCTFSNHRALAPAAREGLPSCVRELIDARHGGRGVKRALHELITAPRTASAAD